MAERTDRAIRRHCQRTFDKVIDDVVVNSPEEYLLAAQVLVTQRNARVDRSGSSPDQRTFGRSIRLPGHMLSDDKVDADLLGAQASDPICRMWDLQDAASRACVTRRNVESCKRALRSRRRDWQSRPLDEGSWVFVWRTYDGEGGWYGPGLHLARRANNRSHWVNMGARLWKCSREQLRPATDEECLSAEVAACLSKEFLQDVETGHTAKFIDVAVAGPPPDWQGPSATPMDPEPEIFAPPSPRIRCPFDKRKQK